ncbi:hypothetical protein [Desulfosarcina sp.]|uniref:hypothetical protein n=1 Tax=Desulfosarcina sp. TaxID=2027861 RepID=UPI003970C489
MKTTAWIQTHRLPLILVMVTGILAGCASVFQGLDDKMHRKQFKSAHEAFERALAVYDEGDFEKALTRFKAISEASASEKISRKALLGQICCRLLLADTQAEYTAAIGMWHDFAESTPDDSAVWDLTLLDPLIVRMTPKTTTAVIYINPPAAKIAEEPAATEDLQPDTRRQDTQKPDDRELRAEVADLKEKVERAAQLQHQIDEVTAENLLLKEKIKALEAIDQNIQKKKTEISAPSE